jgi:trehalose-6-phosphate synthase
MLFLEKPERERQLKRSTRSLVNNINMDFGEIGWGSMDWIGLAQDRHQWKALVKAVIILGFHKILGSS